MAKSLLKIEARKLRKQGVSVKNIALSLGVTKGSVSLWVRDIILNIEQLENLTNARLKGAALGRLRSALLQKNKRIVLQGEYEDRGIKLFQQLTKKEFMIAGLSLYWAEGGKTNRRIEFCNSDPKMIKFITLWLQKEFEVKKEDFTCYIQINGTHLKRKQIVERYWSNIMDLPLNQFRKTHFKKTASQKKYENYNDHYGTLNVRVAKSSQLYYKIMGLIKGLKLWQGSLVG